MVWRAKPFALIGFVFFFDFQAWLAFGNARTAGEVYRLTHRRAFWQDTFCCIAKTLQLKKLEGNLTQTTTVLVTKVIWGSWHQEGDEFSFETRPATYGTVSWPVVGPSTGAIQLWIMKPSERLPAYQGPLAGLAFPYEESMGLSFRIPMEEVAWNLSIMRLIACCPKEDKRRLLIRRVISSEDQIAARWALGFLSPNELIDLIKRQDVDFHLKIEADSILTDLAPWESEEVKNKLADWEWSSDRVAILKDISERGNYSNSREAFSRLANFFARTEQLNLVNWMGHLLVTQLLPPQRKVLALRECCKSAIFVYGLWKRRPPPLEGELPIAIPRLKDMFVRTLNQEEDAQVRLATAECMIEICAFGFSYPELREMKSELEKELNELLGKETDEEVKKELSKALTILRKGPPEDFP